MDFQIRLKVFAALVFTIGVLVVAQGLFWFMPDLTEQISNDKICLKITTNSNLKSVHMLDELLIYIKQGLVNEHEEFHQQEKLNKRKAPDSRAPQTCVVYVCMHVWQVYTLVLLWTSVVTAYLIIIELTAEYVQRKTVSSRSFVTTIAIHATDDIANDFAENALGRNMNEEYEPMIDLHPDQ